jgi:23S rRNA pseudouridine1911/1915/1917 synthase
VRPGIVTRLDKETSGVMLVALTPGIHARLQRSALRKEYLAVVRGTPSPAQGTIDLALAHDPLDRRRMVVSDEGIPSTTRYEVMSTQDDSSLVRCELVTGRTHQIRVHLSACGWPILGDAVYGVIDARIARVALHAWRVTFVHPVSGEDLKIESPLADDIAALVRLGA